ncbi:MAG: protein-glutamate O-methyltransferase CheR [Deltaproteobacteria bacterium]|nr:MAG: protein-glutamate O-methyltransferase CheR [Deltaproteobacteria bacterium]
MMLNEPLLKLSEEEYCLIRDLIRDYCGIYFDSGSKFLLEKRLMGQVRQHQLASFRDYFYFLKYGRGRTEELGVIVELLTTNETYFFREDFQLRAFREEIIPEVVAAKRKEGQKELRIWSAGCSTGEEPYTLAMMVLEEKKFAGWKVEIFASDISHRVLRIARKGVYSKSSFRVTPERYVKEYFVPLDGKLKIRDEVKKLVNFSYLNLLNATKIKLLPKMDIVFCRNVLIYFDHQVKRKVVESFYDLLTTGGFLLLGHAESLMNVVTSFKLRHFRNDLVYQKP